MHTGIHSGGTGNIRHSPRNGFNGYGELSPATNSSCHRRQADERLTAPGRMNEPPRSLTPATGARTTRFDRPQHCRSSRAPLSITHEFDLALRSHAHTTSSRPPHPASTFVTIAIRPSVVEAGWRETCHRFLKNRSYFLPKHLDNGISLELFIKFRFYAHAVLSALKAECAIDVANGTLIRPSAAPISRVRWLERFRKTHRC